jgi:hypothetical protein
MQLARLHVCSQERDRTGRDGMSSLPSCDYPIPQISPKYPANIPSHPVASCHVPLVTQIRGPELQPSTAVRALCMGRYLVTFLVYTIG